MKLQRYTFCSTIVEITDPKGRFRPLLTTVNKGEVRTGWHRFVRIDSLIELRGRLPQEIRTILDGEFQDFNDLLKYLRYVVTKIDQPSSVQQS